MRLLQNDANNNTHVVRKIQSGRLHLPLLLTLLMQELRKDARALVSREQKNWKEFHVRSAFMYTFCVF